MLIKSSQPASGLSELSYHIRGDFHHSIRRAVAGGLRTFGRRFRRSNSSSATTSASGCGRPESKDRRRQNRDSYDVYSESSASKVLNNTPVSGVARTPDAFHGVLDPLAVAGMVIATAELDRLSSIAERPPMLQLQRDVTSKSDASIHSKLPRTSSSVSRSFANDQTTCPSPTSGAATPVAPANSPLSGASTPTSSNTQPLRACRTRGSRRRATRSRLSEVCSAVGVKAASDTSGNIVSELK